MPLPRGRDLEVTREQLRVWLSARLPESESLDIQDLRGPKDTGFSSDTLMFKMTSSEGEREMVLRLAPSGDFLVFPEYDVALQFRMMDALAGTPVPAPRMAWLEEDPEPLGSAFYIMDRVEGLVPSDSPPYHAEGWLFELSPEDRARVWNNGLDAMSEVHKLAWNAPQFSFLKPIPTGLTSMEAQLRYWEDFMEWGMERERYSLLNRGLDWLTRNAPADGPLSICWGDSRLSNQIFRNCEAVAVIDWEMVFIGNPVADLAWYITLDRILTEGVGLDRMPGMPDRDSSIRRWEENLSRSADDYEYYEVFASFRFSVIMARIFLQMKHFEVLPAEADMDISNLSTPILESLLANVS